MLSIFGPIYGVAVGDGARAMSQEEILLWQIGQQKAMLQANSYPYSYLQGLAQYNPVPEKPLDERFADFKVRLAAAVERHKRGLAIPSQITPHGARS